LRVWQQKWGVPQALNECNPTDTEQEQCMKSLFALLLSLFVISIAAAETPDQASANFQKLSWDQPSKELLDQKYCPIDSTADAMIVQKEMEFLFVSGDLNVISRKRIKIYADRGLSYAQFSETYDEGIDITSIEATSYSPDGTVTKLSPKDIHDEIIYKTENGDLRLASKTFAIPNAASGSVIDVNVRKVFLYLAAPPVFRFQEDIPVGIARFIMNPKPSRYYTYYYSYVISNKELANPVPYFHEDNFICEAKNIPAIENELYALPDRNLATDLWINVKGLNYEGTEFDFASSWEVLLKDYKKGYESAYDTMSKKAKKLADSLMTVTPDRRERIKLANNIVRDRWDLLPYFYKGDYLIDINDIMKQKALDIGDKAIVLWAVLKHMGINSEMVWVSSDNCDYTAMSGVPSLRMFDHALVWASDDSLFLDPSDAGAEVGLLDQAYSDRVMCRPLAESDFISKTPTFDNTSGTISDLKLKITDNGELVGNGTIAFHNQAAIDARRIFRIKGAEESKSVLNKMIFRDDKKGVKSFSLAPDSVQTPTMLQVNYDIELPNFIDGTESEFELAAYPGPSFDQTTIDYNPPRKYPICFNTKMRNVYTVEWNLGDQYKPTNVDAMNFSVDVTLLNYKLLTQYDSTAGNLTVRRQYSRPQKLFDPQFTPSFETFLQNSKKDDLATLLVVKK
jgi:hypothetical protein